jgi:hypothetical protein
VTAVHVVIFLQKVPNTLHQQEEEIKSFAFCLTEMLVKQNRSLGNTWTVSNIRGIRAPTRKSGRANVISDRFFQDAF